MVIAEADDVHERGRERVRFFDCQNLPGRKSSKSRVAKRIGRTVRSAVIQICAEYAIFSRNLVVDARGDEIFVHHLLTVEIVRAHIAATIRGNWIECKILLNEWIDCDGDGISVGVMNQPSACTRRRHEIYVG